MHPAIPLVACAAVWLLVAASPKVTTNQSGIDMHRNWPHDTMSDCGVSVTDRIVGGRNATLGQYPWLARIGIRLDGVLRYDCGGALVSRRHVLTAAHCVAKLGKGNRVDHVLLGENFVRDSVDCEDGVCADPPQHYRVASIAYPRNYNRPLFAHDIAVVTLARPARITEWVLPVCLPFGDTVDTVLVGQMAEVAGWGLTDSDNTKTSDWLQTVRVPVLALDRCRAIFGPVLQIGRHNQQLCVGGKLGEDSCSGDSGGPLVKAMASRPLGGPRHFQYGIVSVGSKLCGETPTPALYSSVRYYLRWILEQMK